MRCPGSNIGFLYSQVLEGSFFWEIVDLKAMMRFTSDTSGARRCLSQLGCTRDVRS